MQLPIVICDECDELLIKAHARLDISTGNIKIVQYIDYDVKKMGFPASREDYDFSNGVLKNGEKEVEFAVSVDKKSQGYFVEEEELEELKRTASALFSGTAADPEQLREKVMDGAIINVKAMKH